MSESSPYFFMKEFSHKELAKKYSEKIDQLEQEKANSEKLTNKLQTKLFELETTLEKLEQAKKELKLQRDTLLQENQIKTQKLLEKEKLSAIGELAARIAHDMRNPLSIIKYRVFFVADSLFAQFWECKTSH